MKIYECDKCEKTFDKKSNYTDHMNRKTSCDKLPKLQKNLQENPPKILEENLEKNLEKNKLTEYLDKCKCIYCEKEFTRKSSVFYHIENNCKKAKENAQIKSKQQEKIDELEKELEESKEIKQTEIEFKNKLLRFENELENLGKQNPNPKLDKIDTRLIKLENELETVKKQNLKLAILLTQLLEKKSDESKNGDIETKLASQKKKIKIPYAMRIKVWNKYIGENIGKSKCKCCEEADITQMKFDCGHIIAESKGGKMHINNLLPICNTCNSSMSNMNMHDYKKLIKEMQE
jgi:hypothetical protein